LYTDAALDALASSPFKPIDEAAVQQQLKVFEESWVADTSNNSTRMGTEPVGSSTAVAIELRRKYLGSGTY
jgi:hypothetical protein